MSAAPSHRLAPAKVNLFLHVGPVDAAGMHPVSSLMAFADIGDALSIAPADADTAALEVDGPFAPDLASTAADDNLVLRAARALLERAGRPPGGFRLRLTKTLPVAAGLGGGSGDAGAAVRLVRDLLAPELGEDDLLAVAAGLGADGPACLRAAPVVGTGYGEVLCPAPALPELHAVLVNPRVACPTGGVYRAYDAGPPADASPPPLPARWETLDDLLPLLTAARNDLEPPAARLVPAVAEALAVVRARPECRLGRLSGSGATVWALVDDAAAGGRLAAELEAGRPGWWIAPCRLGGPWNADAARDARPAG